MDLQTLEMEIAELRAEQSEYVMEIEAEAKRVNQQLTQYFESILGVTNINVNFTPGVTIIYTDVENEIFIYHPIVKGVRKFKLSWHASDLSIENDIQNHCHYLNVLSRLASAFGQVSTKIEIQEKINHYINERNQAEGVLAKIRTETKEKEKQALELKKATKRELILEIIKGPIVRLALTPPDKSRGHLLEKHCKSNRYTYFDGITLIKGTKKHKVFFQVYVWRNLNKGVYKQYADIIDWPSVNLTDEQVIEMLLEYPTINRVSDN